MKRKILIAIVIVTGLAIALAVSMYKKPSEKVVTADAEYTLTSASLFNEFEINENSANEKYLNKVVAVSGRITDISLSDSSNLNVVLSADDQLFGVSCQFPGQTEKNKMKRGDEVLIKGLCTGKLMDVVLVRCVLEKQNKKINNDQIKYEKTDSYGSGRI
jgi:hypothetical protein